MVEVSDEQVDFMLREIRAHGVTIEDLQWNLLDHMCCIIENEMSETEDFYLFFERLLPRFFNDNLREIQEETELLLTFKHFYAMKKTLMYSGLLASVFTLIGSLFKIMHWPGAGVSLLLGIGIFSLLFLPLMIVLKFRDEEIRQDKVVMSFGLLIGMLTSFGFLFKIMHWPYANIMLQSGLMTFTFLYVPVYFLTRFRRPELRFNTIINSVLMFACGGLLFAMYNLNKTKTDLANRDYYQLLTEEVRKLEKPVHVKLDSTALMKFREELTLLETSIREFKTSIIRRSGKIPAKKYAELKEWEAYDYMPNDQTVKQVMNDQLYVQWANIRSDIRTLNEQIEKHFPEYVHWQFDLDRMDMMYATTKIGVQQLTLLQLHLHLLEASVA